MGTGKYVSVCTMIDGKDAHLLDGLPSGSEKSIHGGIGAVCGGGGREGVHKGEVGTIDERPDILIARRKRPRTFGYL